MTLNDLPELGHVGYMCEEVDHFKGMFDPEKVRVYDFMPTKAWAYGEEITDCKMRIALYSPEKGAKQEFVQYVSGTNMCHKEFMDSHGTNIHHIAYYVDNYDEWREYFADGSDSKIIFEAMIEDEVMGKRSSFYATKEGFPSIIEISKRPTKL